MTSVPLRDYLHLGNVNLFRGIPRAEKIGLLGTVAVVVNKLMGEHLNTPLILLSNIGLYVYFKYKQDQAVAAYYRATQYDSCHYPGLYERYDVKPHVEAMGGRDAIHNACATRIFPEAWASKVAKQILVKLFG
jgi:hypothetical protein